MTSNEFAQAPLFGDAEDDSFPTVPSTGAPAGNPKQRKKKKEKEQKGFVPTTPADLSPRGTAPISPQPSAVPLSAEEPGAPAAPAAASPIASRTANPAGDDDHEETERDFMDVVNAISDIIEEFPDFANTIAKVAALLQIVTNNPMLTRFGMALLAALISGRALPKDVQSKLASRLMGGGRHD